MPVSDQGPLQGRYMLIPRTLIFVVGDDQVLLIKGSAHKRLWANRYNGVGGHIERGEDVLSAARRELLEETGLEAVDLWLCGTIMIDAGKEVGIALFVLRGEYRGHLASETVPSAEGLLEWVPIEELVRLPLVEDLPTLLPRVLEMRAGNPPFAARYSYGQDNRLIIKFGD